MRLFAAILALGLGLAWGHPARADEAAAGNESGQAAPATPTAEGRPDRRPRKPRLEKLREMNEGVRARRLLESTPAEQIARDCAADGLGIGLCEAVERRCRGWAKGDRYLPSESWADSCRGLGFRRAWWRGGGIDPGE